MQNVVLIPGIFGTEMLRAGDKFRLWPPIGQVQDNGQPLDTDTRARALVSPTTKPGAIVEGIPLLPGVDIPEYSLVTAFLSEVPATNLVRFPYDWRVDVRTTAAVLADTIGALGDEPVILVAHSMGGLVARYMLECGKYDDAPWFARIRQLVCIATPHLGAPLAVFRLLGLEGMSGFVFPGSAMGILASRADKFPAGHQLLPPANIGCVRLADGTLASVGPAFPSIAPAGIAATAALHQVIDKFARPPAIEYRFAYGFNHMTGNVRDTTVSIAVDDRNRINHIMGEGDGTVPFWSALPQGPAGFLADQFGVAGDHVGMLGDPTLLKRLEDWISPRIS